MTAALPHVADDPSGEIQAPPAPRPLLATASSRPVTVALGVERPGLQEQVLHFLERLPRLAVVAAVSDGAALSAAIARHDPDVVIASPSLVGPADEAIGSALFVVAEAETVEVLRQALRTGARGFYVWPDERELLARDAARAVAEREAESSKRGRVVAVYGPRGGAGATFLATHLSAACAARSRRTGLVDFDLFFGDVTTALGIPGNGNVRTVADLLPVLDEVGPEHLSEVLFRHPRGFSVLLAPHDPAVAELVTPGQLAGATAAMAAGHECVVLHLPRAMDDIARTGLEIADQILLVVTLDVLAFRDARRTLTLLSSLGLDGRCRLVVNRVGRSEIAVDDVERVFGLKPAAVIGTNRAVPRAQNRGELLGGRSGQTVRRIASLAEQIDDAVGAGR